MDNLRPARGRPKKVRPEGFEVRPEDRAAHLKDLGGRLLEQRQLRGWSQSDLAARTNLTATAIREIEQGKRSPMTWTVYLLAQALRCGAGWLAFGG